jgi:hypothetical protein
LFGGKKIHLAVYTPGEFMRQDDYFPDPEVDEISRQASVYQPLRL